MKEFVDWVLDIGNETIGEIHDEETIIDITSDMLIDNSSDPMASIANNSNPSLLENMTNPFFFQHIVILAPTNDIVNELNENIMTLILGETRTYLSLNDQCLRPS